MVLQFNSSCIFSKIPVKYGKLMKNAFIARKTLRGVFWIKTIVTLMNKLLEKIC